MRGLITLLLFTAATPLAAQDFHWTGHLAAGKRLEIKGVNGSIRAMATTDDQIDVSARKTARRSDPDEIEIKVVSFEDGVAICAVYPTPRRARHDNSCEPGDDWSSSTENNDVQVDFTIKLPAGIDFFGRTVNGDLEDGYGDRPETVAETIRPWAKASRSKRPSVSSVQSHAKARFPRPQAMTRSERRSTGPITCVPCATIAAAPASSAICAARASSGRGR